MKKRENAGFIIGSHRLVKVQTTTTWNKLINSYISLIDQITLLYIELKIKQGSKQKKLWKLLT